MTVDLSKAKAGDRVIRKHPTLPYFISSDGGVFKDLGETHKEMKPYKNHAGYNRVCLTVEPGKTKNFFVHRLVLETFVGPCPKGMETRHLDGNSVNNNVSNLAWGTKKENAQDVDRHDPERKRYKKMAATNAYLHSVGKRRTRRGDMHPNSKLTSSDVLEIRKLASVGKTHKEIGQRYGVTRSNITIIVNGDGWQHDIPMEAGE